MLAAVRVRGQVDVKEDIEYTLDNLNLEKKNQLVVFDESDANEGMMNKVKDYITYGTVSEQLLEKLAEKKGSEVESGDAFSCRPPKKGYKGTRSQVGQGGSLGKREDMDELVQRMV
ncbi:uL30 family ribosomal protein [Candidatus Nanohalococcus occultus]|uniref:Ribosomal protein L30 n=2 Tax=Candidatus Nanohalococcus occultus TaxID=2978047 RepID=A0ABY8CJS9_9ARCH|nr:Ribosomal protein L30 [Candidatus Nanohaloarchaeota archaeon SVXNc]